jgi:putative peptidoglycan lipid II flippase
MALLRSVATLGGYTLVSRILGFVRDILIANVLGAGMVADAFFVAFKFPNFFRRLFAEGAFNAAFVPLYARRLAKDGIEPARGFAGDAAAVLSTALAAFTIAAMVAMPWLMFVLAPGFADQPDKFALTTELTRLTFPYLMFMALVALLGGMLNSLERFAATAAAPIILNIVLIAALALTRVGVFDLPGHALAWGVAVAGAGQFVAIAWACHRAGVMIKLPRPRLTPGVRRLLMLMAPGLVGAGVVQVNLVVDVILASLLAEGSVSYLYFADRVNQLPLGVVGVAVGVALLPLLSRQLGAGDAAGARATLNRAIEFSLLLTLPATAALIAMPLPIITVLFQRGAFDPSAAHATAGALAAFACGLPAYVLIKTFTPAFFAREDTATPVKIAATAMVVNIVLAATLMQFFAHVGIALATAISAWLNAALLLAILVRRRHIDPDLQLVLRIPRIVLTSVVMGIVLWQAARWLAALFHGPLWQQSVTLALFVIGGALLFAIFAQVSGAADIRELIAVFRRRPVA